ncbi:MAG: hypothetical protein GXP18_12775 [Gammaproteobacteria bacterium]|nr:hypothetical protein [Gammaproteobacteria bacterium]
MSTKQEEQKSSALPKAWIVPIRLGIYSVLAACSAYIYFNVGDLSVTHYLVIISIVAVAAMALLDCKVSDAHWKKVEKVGESRDENNKPR